MVHHDHETRVAAHRIFSVVLVPSSVCPHPTALTSQLKKGSDLPRTLSRTVSVFSSSSALLDKLKSTENASSQEHKPNPDGNTKNVGIMSRLKSNYSRVYSMKNPPAPPAKDADIVDKLTKKIVRFDCVYIT